MITAIENYRESTLNSNLTGRGYPKLMTKWDYEKNNIDPLSEVLDIKRQYYWKCEDGHITHQTIPQYRFNGCSECNDIYTMLRKFSAHIALSEEVVTELSRVINEDGEIKFSNCSQQLQGAIAYLTYSFDTGLISDELLETYSKLNVFIRRDSDGKHLINKDFSLIPHVVALEKLKEIKARDKVIRYNKLNPSVALWLQFTIAHLLHTVAVPLDIHKGLKEVEVLKAMNEQTNKLCKEALNFYELNAFKKMETSLIDCSDKVKPDDEPWYDLLLHVKQYLDENGHFECLKHVDLNGVNLHHWFINQVKNYQRGSLSQFKREKFDELNLMKAYNELKIIDSKWLEFYELLKEYLSETHLRKRLYRSTIYKGKGLGKWIHSQKDLIDKNQMPTSVMKHFNAINFNFNWCYSLKQSDGDITEGECGSDWEKGLAKLIEFRSKYGCVDVPLYFTTDDGFMLGHWTYYQKRNFNKGVMSSHRKEIFKFVGFDDKSIKFSLSNDDNGKLST